MAKYLLNETDVELIQGLLDRTRNETDDNNFGQPLESEALPPETYVARIPAGGMPAMTDEGGPGTTDAPGSADCNVYRLYFDSTPPYLDLVTQDGQFLITVYNLFGAIAAGEWQIVTRDKYETWWIASAPAGAAADAVYSLNADPTSLSQGLYTADIYTWVEGATDDWVQVASEQRRLAEVNERAVNQSRRYLAVPVQGTTEADMVFAIDAGLEIANVTGGLGGGGLGVYKITFDDTTGVYTEVVSGLNHKVLLYPASPTQAGMTNTGSQTFGGSKRFGDGLTATPAVGSSTSVIEIPDTTNGPLNDTGLGIKILDDAGIYRLTPGNANIVLAVNQGGSRTYLTLLGNTVTLDTPANDGRFAIDGSTGQTGTQNGMTYKGGLWVSGTANAGSGGMTGTIG